MAVAAGAAGATSVLWEMWGTKEESRPAKGVRANAYIENGRSLVSIVRGNSDTEIEAMVRGAVDAIGGMERIVSTGKTVVVKPAVLTSNKDCAPNVKHISAAADMGVGTSNLDDVRIIEEILS